MNKVIKISSAILMGISVLGIASVSLMAFNSPQSVMDLVQVKLENTDAMSSIRGVYGGAGIAILMVMIYLWRNNLKQGMLFLAVFWGSYAISRLLTILIDGALGAFGTQWIVTETVLALGALLLYIKSDEK
jgi:Domain of unknown function (DUF4345)